ncbi:MAG TPA: NHLP leader peptide family RiPP precursor [Leptolyngbya sp.]|nr:NHLP leader peptide family RiPP precursor [Leptolyngbya sp.]
MSTKTSMLLSQVIAKAIHDPEFRSQLLADPKVTLHSMSVPIPDEQSVTVLESKEGQVFFVLPILTDTLIHDLNASLNSVHPQRSIRSKILIKAAQDPSYKAALIDHPRTIFRAEGFAIPESAELTVLENSDRHLYLVLPQIHKHQ